jgi:hypothetical protein
MLTPIVKETRRAGAARSTSLGRPPATSGSASAVPQAANPHPALPPAASCFTGRSNRSDQAEA